ncbi:MAG: penicillin-binding protein 1C [Chloroflexi bacterium]|nr:penicillin-binding protein 1C [Chloroflexota bacterium]
MKRKPFWYTLLILFLLFAGGWFYLFHDLPSVDSLPSKLNQPSIRITDRNGRLLYEIMPEDGGQHAVLPLESMPQCMKDATIAIEDRNFYQNPGVDVVGIIRALWINLTGGETVAGGSTITQQVARNLLLPEERTERTLRRKLREALLAWQMSRKLSKDEILALYLNQSYYGSFAYGVEAASQIYFDKPARDLLLPECALIAGLPQAPSLYNPFTDPAAAQERQKIVLGLMEKDGFISAEQRALAEITPLAYNPAPFPIRAPHFVWLVKARVDELFESGQLSPTQSLIVRTTLDLDKQQLAEETVTRRLELYKPKDGELDQNVNNAALVAMDPHTGEVLALVGSADYFDESIHGSVDMATSPRQSGSAFKPFIYAQALSPTSSAPWTAATPLLDVETTFPTHDGTPYVPKNYDNLEHGPVPVRIALGSSLNIPAVLALDHVGIAETLTTAKKLGIQSLSPDPNEYDLSLALGGGQMSLLELTSAYATFANQGAYPNRTVLLDVSDLDGHVLYTEPKKPQTQVFDPRVAWIISDILSDDRARKIGFGLNSTLKLDHTAAVKTGTTTNFHDNWTIGYTPDLVVGVWVGNSDYQAMHNVTGLTGAAPIWNNYMRAVLQGQPDQPFARPDGIIQAQVCTLSGMQPTPLCPNTQTEWFIAGTEPTQFDTLYKQVWIEDQPVIALDLPASAFPWARSQHLPLLADLAPAPVSQAASLVMISPAADVIYRLSADLDPQAQQIPIQAESRQALTSLSVIVDGNVFITLTSAPYHTWWPLTVGEHRIWLQAVTTDGQILTTPPVMVTVLES